MNWKAIMGFFVLAGASMALMVHVKTDITQLSDERRVLLREQSQLKENLRVQQAEWAHLARPERLKSVAATLGLENIQPTQILPASGKQILGEVYP